MKKAGSRGLRKISRKRTGARPKPAAKALHPGSSAKFSPPRLSRVFHRKRLYRLLDQIRPHRIIWIVSLPGSGKTSLVGGYFAFRRLRSLWYQVDALDADPATFFHNFQTAVRLIRPKAPPLPGYTPDVQADPVRFARQFFRALYRNWRGPRLVFDDYHELPPDSVVHALLRVACEELPVDGLCLFISRVDPPAELVRLRANESMALIGWRELQLTVDETAGIAGLRRPLPKDEVAHLHARTDGWAAGLVLCLEQSGRDRSPNPAGAVTPQAVFDYFAAEILADVGPATRRAVLEASIPPYVTVDLLRQMGLPAAAIEALDLLYRRNAFVTRRSSPEGYDLHPLFREYLRQRAVVELGADRCSGLRRHAAVALAAAGEIDDAADLFRATGAWEELASLVLRDATVWLAQGRYRRLEEWILTVPESIRDRVPWLRYWLAVTRLPFDYGQAQRDMEGAWEGFEQSGDWIGSLLAAAGVLDALFNQFSNFFRADAWIARVERLLAQQSAPLQREIEGIVMAALCKAAVFRCPEHPNLRAWVARLHELAQEERDPSRYISYCLPLLLHYGHVGNFDRAAELLPNLRKSAVAPTVPPLLQALAYMCEAIHGWLTGRREIARRAITVGTTLSETHGVVGADNTILAQGVYNALPYGDTGEAHQYLRQIEARLDPDRLLDVGQLEYLAAYTALVDGDISAGLEHVSRSLRCAVEMGTPFPEALNRFVYAHLLFEAGEIAAAQENLDRAMAISSAMRSDLLQFTGGLAMSWFALRCCDRARLLESLVPTVKLGRERNFVLGVPTPPRMMGELCGEALAAGIEPDYVRKVIRACNLPPTKSALISDGWPWSVKVHTLGRFVLIRDGESIRFPRKVQRKPIDFLKALIALGGRDVPEARLTDLLWPDTEGDTAAHAFSITVRRLRDLFGRHEAIVRQEKRVSLDPRYCWVDVWAFERLLGEGTKFAGNNESSIDRERCLEKALELYQGPFLASDDDVPWANPLREYLRGRFVRLIGELGRSHETGGETEKAIECYLKGLDADPLAEGLYQYLMRCYLRQERRAEALAAYRRCVRALSAVGLDPSPETESLFNNLNRGDGLVPRH